LTQAYLLYLAIRTRTEGPARCCTDEPAPRATSSPRTFAQRSRKLARALPVSVRAFRRSLRVPLPANRVAEGSEVVTAGGRRVGHVRGGVVLLDTGDTAVAVVPAHPGATVGSVFLLPSGALRARDDGVVVLDPGATRLVA